MKLSGRQLIALLLLAIGIVASWFLYPQSHLFNRGVPPEPVNFADEVSTERILVALAALLALIPFTRHWLLALLDKLRRPSRKARRCTATLIFVLSQPLLYFLATICGRVLLPYWHDENFYRLQTTFLAHGKLSASALALPEFFDVPYVFTRNIYAVAYFPGTSLLHVPAVWLHLPYFVTPMVIAGITLSLLYLIVTELIDGLSGLIAVTVMLSLVLFRWMALVEMSHAAGAMWGLTAVWSWFCWRRSQRTRWVVLAAIAAGWYAITRPLDCALVLSPVMLAWTLDLRTVSWHRRASMVGLFAIVIFPFLTLQLLFDRTITGHLLQTPMGLYYRTFMNLRGIGLEHPDPGFVPPTSSGVIRDTYLYVVLPRMRDFSTVRLAASQWFAYRLPVSFGSSLPTLLLIVPIPLSLLALRDRRRMVILCSLCAYVIGSGFVFQYLDHYVMAIASFVIILLLIGANELASAFPAYRALAVFMPIAILFLALHRLCLNDQGAYQNLRPNVMRVNYNDLPAKVILPAIVLFRYDHPEHAGAFDEEPAYNWDVVNPDDAPIIRAHDLGPDRDTQLFKYYAERQPARTVYLFDRARWKLTRLGNVKDLASASN